MKFDLHTHHERCGHAIGNIKDYIETAIFNKLDIIGISDHSPFFGKEEDQFNSSISMAKSEFPSYVSEVLQLKELYKDKIEVLLGVESDFLPNELNSYKKIYKLYPFDYVIGSIHISNGLDIFSKTRWDGLTDKQACKEKELYYSLVQDAAKSGMYDILGHIDAMKGNYPEFSNIKVDVLDQTLEIISKHDIAIEVNTSGGTKICGGWYPSYEILERACYYGIKLTFGSDAHTPERVGEDWEEVRKTLIRIGFKQWVFYRNRRQVIVSL